MSKPLEKAENDIIQEIGNKFYNTCEANEQSGKTLWIGIERSKENKWVVRFLLISDFDRFSNFFTILRMFRQGSN